MNPDKALVPNPAYAAGVLSANAGTVPEQNVTRLVSVLPLILAAALEYAVLTAVKYEEIRLVPVYEPEAAVHVLAILTPPLLLRVAPAIICSGVNILAAIC